MAMELFFKDTALGSLIWLENEDMPWEEGKVTLFPEADEFRKFFWVHTKDADIHPGEFPEAWLDQENWNIRFPDGERYSIEIPVVYDNGQIYWRWVGEDMYEEE